MYLVLVNISLLLGSAIAATVPPWNIQLTQQQGPNVCVVEELPGTKYKLWTDCKYWTPRNICGNQPVLTYDCCAGFKRIQGEFGCTSVNPLENILDTARNLGATRFVRYIEESGSISNFMNRGPITLFAPSDETFQEMSADKIRKLDRMRPEELQQLLLYHSVNGRLYSDQFKGDLLIESRQPNSRLRINKFSSKIDTVNCARILRKDEEATNGVVHIIDTLLDPESWQSIDISEAITRDGRFIRMARALDVTGISQKIRISGQPVTIFVPSDEAFESLSTDHLYKLTNDRNALTELVNSHIIPHPLCLPALTKDLKLRTQNEETKLDLQCETGRYLLESNRLPQQFIMTPKGIIHPIDYVVLPNTVKTTDQLLERNNTRIFRNVFRTSDLERTLRDSRSYTIFVPSDQAMSKLPSNYLQSLRTNRAEARKFASYHILKKKFLTEDIVDNERQRLMDEDQNLVFQVHRKSFGVNGAIIEEGDIRGLDCTIHIISKALIPPTKNVQQTLRSNISYSIFLEALDRAKRYDPQIVEESTYKTILIPDNQAFNRLGQYHLERLRTDRNYLTQVIRNHIIDGMHSSEAFQPNLHYTIKSNGNDISINKYGTQIRVNGGEMMDCDIATTNGLVHTVNKVLVPDDYY